MGTNERDQQAQEERERQEQLRQEQDRMNAPREMGVAGDNETSTTPVIINH